MKTTSTAFADRLGDLVELERREGQRTVREVALEAAVELGGVLAVVLKARFGERVVPGRRGPVM